MRQAYAMNQVLGWGGALIALGVILALLAITGVFVIAALPWIAGLLIVAGIIMAVVGAAGRARAGPART